MTILFYDEQMTITYSGKDQRKGTECPPLGPTVTQVDQLNVRPRGADIIDIVQDGDTIMITANGNGTGTVTVSAYIEKPSEIGLSLDERTTVGSWETSFLGSKSVINTLSPAITEEVTVLAPQILVELEQEIDDPEIDCNP